MLTIMKLLNAGDGTAWGHHIAGAAELIRFRDPSTFVSNFDKSMLVSLSYPIVSRNTLRQKPTS